jgi:hypothetical protein
VIAVAVVARSSQVPGETAKGKPFSGIGIVQLGIALSKEPAPLAAANPKIISWACQVPEPKADAIEATPLTATSQKTMADLRTAVPRKSRRMPPGKSAGASADR